MRSFDAPSWISLFCQKVKRKSEQKMKHYSQLMAELKKNSARARKKIRKKEAFCQKRPNLVWSNLYAKMRLSCMAMSNVVAKQLTP